MSGQTTPSDTRSASRHRRLAELLHLVKEWGIRPDVLPSILLGVAGTAGLCGGGTTAHAQGLGDPSGVKRYIIFDGRQYNGPELESASRSPVLLAFPRLDSSTLWVPRAADGHYYVSGFVNGFPVVFLVDTGATTSSIPTALARNTGIRTGLSTTVNTASGQAAAAVTGGNQIVVGPFTISDARLVLTQGLQTPLLGMDVLNRYAITYAGGAMTLRAAR